MLKMLLKRKSILNRDQTLFGTYADYILDGLDESFSKSELSIRQRAFFFRCFLKRLIDRFNADFQVPVDGHVIIPCHHEYLSAPDVESLFCNLADVLAKKKCYLVIELSVSFPEFRSGVRGVLQRAICGVIYSLRDRSILFSLRCVKRPDDLTLKLICGQVFSFFSFAPEFNESFINSAKEKSVPTRCAEDFFEFIGGRVKAIAVRIDDGERFEKALGMPFFFFCGAYFAPAGITEIT